MPTTANFRIDFPAFADVATHSDAVIDRFIAKATQRLSAPTWASAIDEAIGYYAAHLLALRDRQAAGGIAASAPGAVTAANARAWGVSYGATAATKPNDPDADLKQTSYGMQLIELRSRIPAGRPFAMNLGL